MSTTPKRAAQGADLESGSRSNFIREIIDKDLQEGKHGNRVATRFPPEPNGYLHIGHAKSICLNFGIARDYAGTCNLRFDDTNPSKESTEYVESIKNDVRWLGFDWRGREYYASDYFEKLYAFAERLIQMGKAYVCSLSAEEIREYRGTLTEPGKESPYRARSVDENLDLFRRMRAGEFGFGEHVLRAKIDMASPNMLMRDPTLYRIKHVSHHRTGDKWCIYPMYDFTHCLSDAIEEITHSICTLEFENNRELYDWVLDSLGIDPRPHQYEFARPQPDAHRAQQAPPDPARGGGPRERLGRPAHAHAFGAQAPGVHARGHSLLLRPHRRGQERQRGGILPAGVLPARGPQCPRAPAHGRGQSA